MFGVGLFLVTSTGAWDLAVESGETRAKIVTNTRVRQLTNQVTVLREGVIALRHPIDNPIVIEDDDDRGAGLVEPENGVPPGQLIEIEDTDDEEDEDDDEEEEMADDDEARDGEAIGEALQVRIAAADPAPEYLPPPDYD